MNQQKNKDKENKTCTLEVKKESSMMVISLLPNGDIVVQDHSHQNSRKELVQHLQEMGVKTKTTLESLCG